MKVLVKVLGELTRRNMSLLDMVLYGLCVQHYIQNQKFLAFFLYIILSVGISVLVEKLHSRLKNNLPQSS